jgi:hypothetical protein
LVIFLKINVSVFLMSISSQNGSIFDNFSDENIS